MISGERKKGGGRGGGELRSCILEMKGWEAVQEEWTDQARKDPANKDYSVA